MIKEKIKELLNNRAEKKFNIKKYSDVSKIIVREILR